MERVKKLLFTKEGIRGKVGEDLTPIFMVSLGEAIGYMLRESIPAPLVLVGKDTRLSGYWAESALVAGLLYSGVNVRQTGPMAAAGIAVLTGSMRADLGIVITAPNDSYELTGLKIFTPNGEPLTMERLEELEQRMLGPIDLREDPAHNGRNRRIDDAGRGYIELIKGLLPTGSNLKGARIVLDCAHGAMHQIAPTVLDELEAEVITINNQPEGRNINVQGGIASSDVVRREMLRLRADYGIVLNADNSDARLLKRSGEEIELSQVRAVMRTSRRRVWAQDGLAVALMVIHAFSYTQVAKPPAERYT